MGFKWNPITSQLDYFQSDVLSAKVLVLERTAGETISALKAVYLTDSTTCKLANNTDDIQGTVIGISLTAGNLGDTIKILSFGIIDDPFFTYTINDPVFLGTNGNLITTQPSSGVLTEVGYGLGAGSFYVKPNSPKIL